MNTLDITRLLTEYKLCEAFQLLKPLALKTSDFRFTDRLQSLWQNYSYLIDYFTSGQDDPQRHEVLSHIIAETFILYDDICQVNAVPSSLLLQMKAKVADFITDLNRFRQLKKIFYDSWSGSRQDDSDIISADEKRMFVAGTAVSLIERFSENKLLTLCRCVQQYEGAEQQYALVSLLLLTHTYNYRLPFFPKITEHLRILSTDKRICESTENICIQLLQTSLTPLISREIDNLSKQLMPEIRNNNDSNILITIEELDEENPQWGEGVRDIFNDHIGEMTRLHKEGADINYASTKGILTNGFFHNDIANWFMPFYEDNTEINIDFNTETGKLLKGILLTNPGACDTDKYALCAIYRHIQSQLSATKLPSLISDMSKFGDADKHYTEKSHKESSLEYIRSFYRFCFNNPWQITNIMTDITRIGTDMAIQIILPADRIQNLANRCIALNLYQEAADLLTGNDTVSLQKRGFVLQKLGLYEQAIEAYRLSMKEQEDDWTLRHIAYCLQKIDLLQDALQIYDNLLPADPDNRKLLMQKAQCLLSLKRYKEALDVFFHLDLLFPNDTNIQRGLAWCAFCCDDRTEPSSASLLSLAEEYMEKLVYGDAATANDHINYGHLLLVGNHRSEAVNAYIKSTESKQGRKLFIRQMQADTPLLISKGVNKEDIHLVIQSVLINTIGTVFA